MASTRAEIKTEQAPAEFAAENKATDEYFNEEVSSPIAKVAGTGNALVKNSNGTLGLRFLPVNKEAEYNIKATLKG